MEFSDATELFVKGRDNAHVQEYEVEVLDSPSGCPEDARDIG